MSGDIASGPHHQRELRTPENYVEEAEEPTNVGQVKQGLNQIFVGEWLNE